MSEGLQGRLTRDRWKRKDLLGAAMSQQSRIQIVLVLAISVMLPGPASGQESSKVPADGPANEVVHPVPSKNTLGDSTGGLQKRSLRYTVHPADTLELTFPLTPEFNQTVTAQPDGSISLRGVGDLSVGGQTLAELTESLVKAYKKILKDPMIYVDPKDYQKPYFIVGGQVSKPGKFDWRGDVTVTEAIAIAGGFDDTAKHSQVLMFRRISNDWAEAKLINVKHMLNTRNLYEDPLLQPGDMLYVPKNTLSKVKPFLPIPSLGLYSSQF
jgi:polysaccharide export outer membrane protein